VSLFLHRKATLLTMLLAMCAALTACGGIPLRSIPKLMNLQNELLILNPADFKLAIQTDSLLTPPAGSVPLLELSIKPAKEGGFEPHQKLLPMRFEAAVAPPGLSPAANGRRWLLYSFPPESQAELRLFQAKVKNLMAEKTKNGGGSIAAGISQDGLAPDDPRMANTQWNSWLQTDAKGGFFELWSGTVKDLKAAAKKSNT
jgi:hypothetical protein